MTQRPPSISVKLHDLAAKTPGSAWLFLALICLMSCGYYFAQMRFWTSRMETKETETVRLASERILSLLDPTVDDLVILSEDSTISSLLEHPGDQARRIATEVEFLQWCRRKSNYFEIRLLDENGVELVKVRRTNGAPLDRSRGQA